MSYKRWLFIALSLFCLGLVLGLGTPMSLVDYFFEGFSTFGEFAHTLLELPQIVVFFLIFLRNTSVVLISFVLSPLFCLVPVLALVVNGWFLGLVSIAVLQVESIPYLLAGLLPHGIFEIPALIMAEAVCLSFGTVALLAFFKKEQRGLVIPNLKQNLKYMVIVIGLLLIAAIIETYITPLLFN